MTQSLTKNLLHIIFSTKDRQRFINDDIRDGLHSYIHGISVQLSSPLIAIGSVEDHIHIFVQLSKNIPLSKLIENIKTGSSRWIKTKNKNLADFYWQSGYAAFSVSESGIKAVTNYIANQREHHLIRSFEQELILILDKHEIKYDKKYL